MDDEIKSEEQNSFPPFEVDETLGAPFRNVKDSVFKKLYYYMFWAINLAASQGIVHHIAQAV